jgi:hypothetical protein
MPAINAIVAKTASYTCAMNDAGTRFTNRGATGPVTFTLPAPATVSPGDRFTFSRTADFNVIVNGGIAAGILGLTGTGITMSAVTAGNYGTIVVESDGVVWQVIDSQGTWGLA